MSKQKYTQLELEFFPSANKAPTQTARAPARGHYYQLRYAARTALMLKRGDVLGFELIDDVDVATHDGMRRIVQVKNELAPLTDKNRGLWKALAHWSADAERDPTAFRHVRELVFATTAPIRPGTFPSMLATDSPPAEREQRLRHIEDSDNTELQRWIAAVRAVPPPRLCAFLEKVRIVSEGDADVLRGEIRGLFRERTFPEERLDEAMDRFEGWLMQRSLEAFVVGDGARVEYDTIIDLLLNMREGMHAETLRFRHREMPVDEPVRATYRQHTFVRQLEAISVEPSAIEDAVVDYLRNISERVDWARYQEVGQEHLDAFETELFRRWEHRFHDIGGYRHGLQETQWGCRLYSDVLEQERPHLWNREPPSHVIRGTYHKMADEPLRDERRVGWHPRWESLFPPRDSDA